MTASKIDLVVMAGCGAATLLLGEAGATSFPDWVTDAGALGVLAFYMFWNTTQTIPGMQKAFIEQLSAQRAEFIKELDAKRDEFVTAVESLSEHTRQTIESVEAGRKELLAMLVARHKGEGKDA